MRRALPYVFLVAMMAVAGCGSRPIPKFQFRTKNYHRIVTLSPSCAEIVAGNADTQYLVGRTAADDYPDNVMKPVPIVSGVKPDYEKISEVKPDLILCDESLYSKEEIDKIKSTNPHADVYVVNGDTVDAFLHQLYELGSMLANEIRFNDYANRILAAETDAKANQSSTKPKVAVVLPSPDGQDLICGTDSFVADVVKIAGGTPVGPKGNLFVAMNPEMLVSLNPDVIICSGTKADMAGAEALAKDSRLQTVTAIKKGATNIGIIDPEILERRGQRVDNLIQLVHNAISSAGK